jgi:hypothetical protein
MLIQTLKNNLCEGKWGSIESTDHPIVFNLCLHTRKVPKRSEIVRENLNTHFKNGGLEGETATPISEPYPAILYT